MGDAFEGYSGVMNALVSEAIACSPESWSRGSLSIQCDGSYMDYALRNGEAEDKAQISGELRALCEELYVVMRQSGDVWLAATIDFFREGDQWSFKAEFKYPKTEAFAASAPVPTASAAAEPSDPAPRTPPSAKPWWRFW